MSDREAMKLALEALEWAWGGEPMGTKEQAAMQALRTALAAEQQEPVADEEAPRLWAWMREGWSADCGPWYEVIRNDQMTWRDRKGWTPLYTALDAALAEPEPALQVDALRYRWIAENALAIDFVADPDNMVQIWHGTDPARFSAGKTLDEAVDAARRRT
jgi:hypothetical protein